MNAIVKELEGADTAFGVEVGDIVTDVKPFAGPLLQGILYAGTPKERHHIFFEYQLTMTE